MKAKNRQNELGSVRHGVLRALLVGVFSAASLASLDMGGAAEGDGWVHCMRTDGVSCTAVDLSVSSDMEGDRSAFDESCRCDGTNCGDADVSAGASDGKCPTEDRIAYCTGGTGTLEFTGTTTEFEASFYSPTCSAGFQDPNAAITNTCNSVGGSLSMEGGC